MPHATDPPKHSPMLANLTDLLGESALEVQEARLDPEAVGEQLMQNYGLRGTLQRIATEKDDTFVLTAEGKGDPPSQKYLVKISSSFEDPDLVDFQSAVLEHVAEEDVFLPVPRILRTVDGQLMIGCFSGSGPFPRILRVLSYLDGEPLGTTNVSRANHEQIGRLDARLSVALSSFGHPKAKRPLAWDLANFPKLEPLLRYTESAEMRELLMRQFAIFDEQIVPRLPDVTHQVVHNDMNRYNVLIRHGVSNPRSRSFPWKTGIEISGVIDFGDVVYTALPFDLAIAASSQLTPSGSDPWVRARSIVRGYREVRPLTTTELEVVVWAAPVRVAVRTLLINYQSALNPERGVYLNSHITDNLAVLKSASKVSASSVLRGLV